MITDLLLSLVLRIVVASGSRCSGFVEIFNNGLLYVHMFLACWPPSVGLLRVHKYLTRRVVNEIAVKIYTITLPL